MSSNHLTTIGQIAEVYDGPHATPKKTMEGPIFLGIPSLNKGRLDISRSAHLSEKDFTKWTKRVTPSIGDVVFSYETRLGEAAIIPEGLRCCLGRRLGLLRPNRDRVIPEYLLYAYLGPDFQTEITARTIHGSTVDRIALKDLPDFPIRIPPLEEQMRVVNVLKSIDDKIEINHQIDQTLEQIAQAIFKSWFVDFEPVKAKMEAKQNGQDPDRAAMCAISGKSKDELDQLSSNKREQLAATAALFPDKLEDSELGLIPAGWATVRFKAIVKKYIDNRGKTPPTAKRGVPLLEVKHLPDQEIRPNLNTNKYVTQETYDSWFRAHLEEDDIIISTVGTIGRICLVPKNEKFAIAQNLLGMRFDSQKASAYFMYYQMDSFRFRHDVDARLVITVQSSIKRKDLETIDLLLPPITTQNEFERLVKPLVNKQQRTGNETLKMIRDTLLPKLLSGEIELKQDL